MEKSSDTKKICQFFFGRFWQRLKTDLKREKKKAQDQLQKKGDELKKAQDILKKIQEQLGVIQVSLPDQVFISSLLNRNIMFW